MDLLKPCCEYKYYEHYDDSKLLNEIQQNISTSIASLDKEYAYVFYRMMNTRPCIFWNKDVYTQTVSLLEKLFQDHPNELKIEADTYNYFLMGYDAYCQLCDTILDISGFNIEQEIKTRLYRLPTYSTILESCLSNFLSLIAVITGQGVGKDYTTQNKLGQLIPVLESNGYTEISQRINVNIRNAINHGKVLMRKNPSDQICFYYVENRIQKCQEMPIYEFDNMIDNSLDVVSAVLLATGMLMEITFPQYDVRFIAVNDGVDSINGVSDFSGIKNYFNDFYARDTSRKIRAVQKAKGERGERVGTTIPYGYLKNPEYKGNQKEHPLLIVDPETAPVVKRIFDMYASGIGIVKICDILSKEKIISPSVYIFQRTGGRIGKPDLTRPYHWAQNSVRKMLSNQEYVGDTVNFKTYTKSNKLKKRLKNSPENILVFRDTHEAIIDRKTFEIVQRHFAGRKRPDKQGEMDKYAGYLFCGECGKRLYLHRSKSFDESKNNFMCGGYQSRTTDCTSHYIRESVLDEIVLRNLRQVTEFARERTEEFYAMATANGEAEAERFYKAAEKEKQQLEKRITELDNIIRCLYEDRVCGRITPERYDTMASGYEQEQTALKEKLIAVNDGISKMDMRDSCIREFIAKAKQYIEMPTLTPELLRVFIRKIEVFEKLEKYSRTAGNLINIHYAFQLPEQDGMPVLEILLPSNMRETA